MSAYRLISKIAADAAKKGDAYELRLTTRSGATLQGPVYKLDNSEYLKVQVHEQGELVRGDHYVMFDAIESVSVEWL